MSRWRRTSSRKDLCSANAANDSATGSGTGVAYPGVLLAVRLTSQANHGSKVNDIPHSSLVMRHSSIFYHHEHALPIPTQPCNTTLTYDGATFGAAHWRFHGVSNLLVVLICGCGHVHNPWILAVISSSRWCVCWWTAEEGYSVCGLIVLVLQHATTSGSCFEVGETGFNSS